MTRRLFLRDDRSVRASAAIRRPLIALLLLAFLPLASGCSLFVMTGRMLMGETKTKCHFRQATGTDLTKLDCKVLVLCTAADVVKTGYPSVEVDVLEGVTHRLKINGIKKLVNPDAVAGWLDEHGGRLDENDLKDLAAHFHAEYVIHIEVASFTCNEENSPDLLRGKSEGHVRAFHLEDASASKPLVHVMGSDFTATYPQGNPVSVNKKSEKNFQHEYIDHICLQLSQIFYDHPPAEEMQ